MHYDIDTYSMSSIISLKDRHTDATQKLILSTAIELLERGSVTDVTVRAVAKQAGMSERTVFRYFATRDEFLDAVAAEATARMSTPPPPASVDELREFPAPLYKAFEANRQLVEGALHTDIFRRVRATAAIGRWEAVAKLIDAHAPGRSAKERKLASTNVNYFLSASTWHYYRANFELSQGDAVAAARLAIRVTLDDLTR